MSRSYKHTPYWGDKKDRDMKRIANHRVRQKLKNPEFVLKGNEYRKLFCSWDICDYYYVETHNFDRYYIKEVARWKLHRDTGFRFLNDTDEPPTKKDIWKEYCRIYRRK